MRGPNLSLNVRSASGLHCHQWDLIGLQQPRYIIFNCEEAADKIVMEDSIFSKVQSNVLLKALLCYLNEKTGAGLSPQSWWIVLDGRTVLVVALDKCLMNFSKELFCFALHLFIVASRAVVPWPTCIWRPEEKFRELALSFQHARS